MPQAGQAVDAFAVLFGFVALDRFGPLLFGPGHELIALAHGEGATMIVATHELASVHAGTRLIALSNGELTYDGAPADADLSALTEGVRPTAE